MIVARQFIAWDRFKTGAPSRRDGLIGFDQRAGETTRGSIRVGIAGERSCRPYGTGSFSMHIPDNELPGCDYLVPTGQARRYGDTTPRYGVTDDGSVGVQYL